MFDVFLSYKHSEDGAHVARLVHQLKERGLRVFIDTNEIRPFASISKTIQDNVKSSKAFLAWYSQAYLQSTGCTLELTRAVAAHSSSASARILVVNPHSTIDHIHPLWLRGSLCYPLPVKDSETIAGLAEKIVRHVSGLSQLDTLRTDRAPRMFGQVPTATYENLVAFRHAELFDIFDAFHASEDSDATRRVKTQPVLISGPEGIGKSHCIQSYVALFGSQYLGGIFWLDAGKSATSGEAITNICDQMLDLATETGWFPKGHMSYISLTQDPAKNLQLLRDFARTRLSTAEPYLWIVENLPEAETANVDVWKAPSHSGSIASTTVASATTTFAQFRCVHWR